MDDDEAENNGCITVCSAKIEYIGLGTSRHPAYMHGDMYSIQRVV